jgi:cobalt/nickel transport system permease protein
MKKLVNAMLNLNELELFAREKNLMTQLHPLAKVVVILMFILALTSLDKYHLHKALLFGVIPIMMLSFTQIDFIILLKKMILPVCFSMSLGLLNPFFDRTPLLSLGAFVISGGVISLLTLMTKSFLCILATLILVSTTTIEDIGIAMNHLRVPKVMILLLLIMYRYIVVFLDEVEKTLEAYSLRAVHSTSLHISTWGSLVGQIVIRSYRRAEVLYEAMELRGFEGKYITKKSKHLQVKDGVFMGLGILSSLMIRIL